VLKRGGILKAPQFPTAYILRVNSYIRRLSACLDAFFAYTSELFSYIGPLRGLFALFSAYKVRVGSYTPKS
jgi:hypothetical protein